MNRTVVSRTALTVGTLVTLAGLAACTSTGGASSASEKAAGSAAGGAHAAPSAAGSSAASAAAAPARNAAGKADPNIADVDLGSAKIRTAEMTVAIKAGVAVAAQADAAEAIATGAGGEVDADDRTSGRDASATLVLRVPPGDLTASLDELSKLGRERSRHVASQDVTAKVADVGSRVSSAQDSIARLRALYQHATKVADVITIEGELADRESDLESLQAQQRSLSKQTATAAITLSLISTHAAPPPPAKPAQHRTGFLGGLQNGWHAFGHGASALAAGLGAVLPFALLLIVLGIGTRLLLPGTWRRLRPARATPPPSG